MKFPDSESAYGRPLSIHLAAFNRSLDPTTGHSRSDENGFATTRDQGVTTQRSKDSKAPQDAACRVIKRSVTDDAGYTLQSISFKIDANHYR
jgi:hypothetical protein